MIVLDDANVATAARGAVWGAFANCGQSCASVERCYVHESIAAQFTDQVVKETKRLRQASADDKTADLGPLSSERQLGIVERHVTQAINLGAVALTGGERIRDVAGPFYPPTVLTNVTHEMDVMRDETFGPVLPIMTFRTDDEAVRLANDSEFGLTASVWSNNISRGQQLARQIDAGTVTINEVLYTHAIAQTPWGGTKKSGLGRTHGRAGLLELVRAQHVHVNRLPFLPDLWWFNYDEGAGQLFRGFARRFASGSIFQASLLLPQMIRRWRQPRDGN
jgi:succinate-semialdehyde dehydrogenase/glutarate-semialdehyde dehydrogenase